MRKAETLPEVEAELAQRIAALTKASRQDFNELSIKPRLLDGLASVQAIGLSWDGKQVRKSHELLICLLKTDFKK